ncbi:MAG TPA: PP2C family serine/threonine-protein phosphatase [Polyangiaceae bacterium]|jgi:protein phosphatase
MPDPHVLYVVTAVVVLGLVAWVVVVLSRPVADETQPKAGALDAAAGKSSTAPPPAVRSKPPSQPPGADDDRKKLDSHAEISDDPSVNVTAEVPVDVEEEEEPTGPNALILVTAVGRTDPGLKRKHNEDAYAILEDHHLFVIADGMGRHAAGEVASQLCVDAISDAFRKSSFGPARVPQLPKRAARLRGSILLANDRILAAAHENDAYAGMGTTVVSCYFSPNNQRVYIAHVGDSRCYRLRSGKLTQLTMDHTLGAAGIQGKSAAVLSRAVGIEENVEVDISMESPLPGDIYLLCSDGLSRMVQNDEIQSTLENVKNLDDANKILIDKANQGGGRDNITAILVRVDDAKLASTQKVASASKA